METSASSFLHEKKKTFLEVKATLVSIAPQKLVFRGRWAIEISLEFSRSLARTLLDISSV
jgi:hypothetical protein